MASAETHPPFALIARRRQNRGLPPPRLERLDPSFFVVAPGTYDSGGGIMLGGAKMIGGTNSVYHRDGQIFLHMSIHKDKELSPTKSIWVTRKEDEPAQMAHYKAMGMSVYAHFYRLREKATLFNVSGSQGLLKDSIVKELYDFIVSDEGKDDKEKAALVDRLQKLKKGALIDKKSGEWSTMLGPDRRFVEFMKEVLIPHGYDGFVRDIDSRNPQTEIVFFDSTILYEVKEDGSPLKGGPAASGAAPAVAASPVDPGPAAAGAAGVVPPAEPPAASPASDPGGPSVGAS